MQPKIAEVLTFLTCWFKSSSLKRFPLV